MSKNIFELWKEQGEKLPFKIKRDNWITPNVYILVEKVIINKWPYGIAYGKSMHINEKGGEIISSYQHHCKNGIIGCAGCSQWKLFLFQAPNILNSSGTSLEYENQAGA